VRPNQHPPAPAARSDKSPGAAASPSRHDHPPTHPPGGSSTALLRMGPCLATSRPVSDTVARWDRKGASMESDTTRTWWGGVGGLGGRVVVVLQCCIGRWVVVGGGWVGGWVGGGACTAVWVIGLWWVISGWVWGDADCSP